MRLSVEQTREKSQVVCLKSLTSELLVLIDCSTERQKNIVFLWFCGGTNAICRPPDAANVVASRATGKCAVISFLFLAKRSNCF